MNQDKVERNYDFPAAGRTWVVPEFTLSLARDGTLGATLSEFRRIHRAIAAALCGTPGPLTPEEFEFLCDVADVSYASVAARVDLDRSAITKWMAKGRPMRGDRSNLLKRWFLLELFGPQLSLHRLAGPSVLADDRLLLPALREAVLRSGTTFEITERGKHARRARHHSRWVLPLVEPAEPLPFRTGLPEGARPRGERHFPT